MPSKVEQYQGRSESQNRKQRVCASRTFWYLCSHMHMYVGYGDSGFDSKLTGNATVHDSCSVENLQSEGMIERGWSGTMLGVTRSVVSEFIHGTGVKDVFGQGSKL
jgi:hypothetical protein